MRRGRKNKFMGGSLKFKSVKECRMLAFYLYEMLDFMTKADADTGIESDVIKAFLEIAEVLGINEPLSAYLQHVVDLSVQNGFLRPVTCKDDDGEPSCIGYSNIPVAYKEDSRVERWMGDEYHFTTMNVNLFRFLASVPVSTARS